MAFGEMMTSIGRLLAETLLETAKARVESYLQTSPGSTKESLAKNVRLGLDCCLCVVSIWKGDWDMGIGPNRHERRWPMWDMKPQQDVVTHRVSSPYVGAAFCGQSANRKIKATTKNNNVTCEACILLAFYLNHETTTL